MKRRTFYKLSLLLPYLVLVVSLAIAFLTNAIDGFFKSPLSLELLTGVLAFFAVSGIIWGPLYTWMAIVMLIWGRGRGTDDIRRLYILSPVLLACSMGVPAVAFSAPGSIYFLVDGFLRMNNMEFVSSVLLKDINEGMTSEVPFTWFFMAAICVIVGYLFVGIVVWVERVMDKRGRFKDEANVTEMNSL